MRTPAGLLISLLCVQAHSQASDVCTDCDAAHAIEVAASYTGELWHQAHGGLASGTRYLDNAGLEVQVDGDALLGMSGMTISGSALFNNGHALNEALTGSAQGVSNIETTRAARVFELWTQWQASPDRSLRFGLYDLNSEFDHIAAAELFINPSHGIGPDLAQTGTNGPSIFPVTSLGLRGMTTQGPWTFQAVLLDAAPGQITDSRYPAMSVSRREGALGVGEVNYRTDAGVRLGIGYWQYTADFDDLEAVDSGGEPVRRDDNAGAYLILESAEIAAGDSGRVIGLYTRFGIAEAHVNDIARYYGVGAVCEGLLPIRAEHRIGLAAAIAELGDPALRTLHQAADTVARREFNYELTGQFPIGERLTIQADVQYIDHPGMRTELASVWLFGLRLQVGQRWTR